MTAPKHVFEIYIQATPERVWQAITDPELTRGYYYGTAVESAWLPGSAVRYTYPDGSVAADGAVIEVDPPRRLVTTFSALWDETVRDEPPARVTWEIEPMGDACRVALTFGDMVEGSATERSVAGGGSVLLSGMKTLLETGRSLTIGEPVGVSAG